MTESWFESVISLSIPEVRKMVGFGVLPQSPGDEGSIVTGMPSGKLYLWRGGQVVLALAAHGTGPEIVTPEGSVVGVKPPSPLALFALSAVYTYERFAA